MGIDGRRQWLWELESIPARVSHNLGSLGLRPPASSPEVKQPRDRAEWQAMEPEELGDSLGRVVVIGLGIFRN